MLALSWWLRSGFCPLPVHTELRSAHTPHTLPDVGDVGHPLQVSRDRVEADKEPREEEDGDGRYGSHKGRHLGGHTGDVLRGSRWLPRVPWGPYPTCLGRVTSSWERARAPGCSHKARTAPRSPCLPACSLCPCREGQGCRPQRSGGPSRGRAKRDSLPQEAGTKANGDEATGQHLDVLPLCPREEGAKSTIPWALGASVGPSVFHGYPIHTIAMPIHDEGTTLEAERSLAVGSEDGNGEPITPSGRGGACVEGLGCTRFTRVWLCFGGQRGHPCRSCRSTWVWQAGGHVKPRGAKGWQGGSPSGSKT